MLGTESRIQCYESSLGTKRISLHKWVCVSVIFSAQISRLEQQCVPHHLVEAVDVRDSYLQAMNVKIGVMFQHVCYTV